MSDLETLQARVIELRDERATLVAAKTKEDLHREVADWVSIAKAQAAGAARLVLNGQAAGDHLLRVLAEDRLADDDLAERLVARLERDGFGQITDGSAEGRSARQDRRSDQASRDGAP
jgi:hypothetical protein